ncbi:hypothetical protein PSQ40_05695 [Curvibacter sp. HBC61]|uniref:Uncharacterized protein n=1 Tax=Curvibacter cyanobacteriorum TaxID=3026422 RepID=A0ABT5MXI7_9BURK|nr:hypothetical protein [Curvibacter sp. HBC61]MDD0838059.1 hypothetical protein [Curvibacter sp. HBC61]
MAAIVRSLGKSQQGKIVRYMTLFATTWPKRDFFGTHQSRGLNPADPGKYPLKNA